MPASVNKKCFACAFNTIEFAKEQTCWNCDHCQPKRSYYRKRESINANRRAKYKQALTKDIEIIQIETPSVTAAFLKFNDLEISQLKELRKASLEFDNLNELQQWLDE